MEADDQANEMSDAGLAGWDALADHERVYYWRLGRLLELGYPVQAAEELAGGQVDLHALETLVSVGGCSLELAHQILA
jgi:hypothetical protein